MAAADAIPVIQATLAPAFLITGGGIFLNFVQNRLFRVMDRVRELAKERAEATAERQTVLERQARIALRRARTLRNAIAFGVVGLSLIVVTMLVLLATVVWNARDPIELLVVLPFGLALGAFSIAFTLGVRDTFMSFQSVAAEFEGPR